MSNVTYNNTEKLRFWCQKVLPLVYDDSLSYYELLNKMVVYLNSTIEDVQAMIADVTRIEQGLSSKIDVSQKGIANGVATLNGNGQVPLSQLPDISAGVQTISVNGVNVPADANKNVNIIVMTNAVSNLVNYYLKSETYNKTEVNALIDNVKNSRFEVVAELPTSDIQTNVIYLVPKSVGQTVNGYDEFINLNGTTSGWELIGSTDIDLSGYVTDGELATALSAYVTTQSLNTTLAGYVTNGTLASTLEGYVTNVAFESLRGTVVSQGNSIAGLATTVNEKVDKVTGKGLSTNDYSNTDKDIVDNIQDNVIANTKLIKDTVGWSGKNIIGNPEFTGGTIFSIENDNSVVFNGTPSGDSFLNYGKNVNNPYYNYTIPVKAGKKYHVNGCPEGGSGSGSSVPTTYGLRCYGEKADHSLTWLGSDFGDGIDITIPNDVIILFVQIAIKGGTVLNNVVFKPMVIDGDILDRSYEPYVGTTAFPRSEQAVLGAKNRIAILFSSLKTQNTTGTWTDNTYEKDGVTFECTVDSSGYVTNIRANGTASSGSAQIDYDLGYSVSNGSYKLNGTPAGGGTLQNNNWFLGLYKTNTGSGNNLCYDFGDGADVNLSFSEPLPNLYIRIGVSNGKTITNGDFKPMLSFDGGKYVPYAMTNRELTENITKLTKKLTVTFSNESVPQGAFAITKTIPNIPTGYTPVALISYGISRLNGLNVTGVNVTVTEVSISGYAQNAVSSDVSGQVYILAIKSNAYDA